MCRLNLNPYPSVFGPPLSVLCGKIVGVNPCLFFSVTSVAKKSASDRPQNRNSRQTKKSVLPRPEHGRMDSWLYFSVFSVLSVAKKSVLIGVNLCLTDPKTAIPAKLKNLCYLVLSIVEWIRGYISLCSRWPLWLKMYKSRHR
jgi:hypothetical protein